MSRRPTRGRSGSSTETTPRPPSNTAPSTAGSSPNAAKSGARTARRPGGSSKRSPIVTGSPASPRRFLAHHHDQRREPELLELRPELVGQRAFGELSDLHA